MTASDEQPVSPAHGGPPALPPGPPPAGMPYWPMPAPQPQPAPPPSSTSAHASVAFGIVALVFSWVPLLGAILGVVGISLGLKAWRLADAGYDSQRGVGTAGIVVSAVAIGIGLIVLLGVVLSVVAVAA